MKNYDSISENFGKHGPMLYIFKMLTVANAKKLELGFPKFHMLQI